jgi:hypothetical protein
MRECAPRTQRASYASALREGGPPVEFLAVLMERWDDPAVLLPRALGWPTPLDSRSLV